MGPRSGVATVLALVLAPLASTGCSALLDFSDKKIPIDAATDAPYTPTECMYKEPNDSPADSALITPMDTGPAAICPNDVDYYQFAVPAMTTSVSIKILFTNSVTGDLSLTLFDVNGSMLAGSDGFADNQEIDCPSAMCATLGAANYIFEVAPAVPGNVNNYGIQLTLTPGS